MESIDELKKKAVHYEKVLGIAEGNLAYKGYLSSVKIVQQQVDFLNDFSLKANIDGKKAETAIYDRAESLWSNLPKMITSLRTLQDELKIEYDANEDAPRRTMTSPQSIGGL